MHWVTQQDHLDLGLRKFHLLLITSAQLSIQRLLPPPTLIELRTDQESGGKGVEDGEDGDFDD